MIFFLKGELDKLSPGYRITEYCNEACDLQISTKIHFSLHTSHQYTSGLNETNLQFLVDVFLKMRYQLMDVCPCINSFSIFYRKVAKSSRQKWLFAHRLAHPLSSDNIPIILASTFNLSQTFNSTHIHSDQLSTMNFKR